MEPQERCEITPQEFGEAIVTYISKRYDEMLAPYRINGSSITLPEIMTVEMADKPLSPVNVIEPMERQSLDGIIFSLSRDEINEALTKEIDLMKRGRKFRGNRVIALSVPLPEKILVKLQSASKGSPPEDFEHIFDGSLA
ncbi:MAG: hypothetical protein A3J76_01945 [Candidatus Moranbacteria bacterium RBG_13_45_13]|nr:MAG: hypothetical protein A3J76_01945 [Candidatus Moranbacteria bacterium RBG_13_45_13]